MTSPDITTTTTTNPPKMKSLILALFATLAVAAQYPFADYDTPYPAPCGNQMPSGRCSTEKACADAGGFYVARQCDFYNVMDVGCCFKV